MRRLTVSRILGALAILLLPAFVLLGWWLLAIAVALAIAAEVVRPHLTGHAHRGRLRRVRDDIRRRLRRHPWRPRPW